MSKWDSPPSHFRTRHIDSLSPDYTPFAKVSNGKVRYRGWDIKSGGQNERWLATHSENGTVRGGDGVERRSRAGPVLGTLTAKRVRRTPLDVPRGDATRTNSGRGSLPETPQAFRPRKTNHAMNCPSKACVKSTNLNVHLHCLNTISIENPTDILTVLTSDSRKYTGHS